MKRKFENFLVNLFTFMFIATIALGYVVFIGVLMWGILFR